MIDLVSLNKNVEVKMQFAICKFISVMFEEVKYCKEIMKKRFGKELMSKEIIVIYQANIQVLIIKFIMLIKD